MKRFFAASIILGLMSTLSFAGGFDEPKGWDSMYEGEFEATFFVGQLDDAVVATGLLSSTGESNTIKNDDGLMIGLRLGKDSTNWGWEVTFAGAFADETVTDFSITSEGDAKWYLLNADLLYYPAGDDFANGKIKPYVGAGPGMIIYNSDSDIVDSETLFDMNVAAGAKIEITEDLPELRLDYRWHFVDGSDFGRHVFKELTLGVCFEF